MTDVPDTPKKHPGNYPTTPQNPRRIPDIGEAGRAPPDTSRSPTPEGNPDPRSDPPPRMGEISESTKSRDALLGTIPKIEPKLSGQINYALWLKRIKNQLFLYDLS